MQSPCATKARKKTRKRAIKYTGPGSVSAGCDGTVVSKVRVKLSEQRVTSHTVRSLPGTFEWRFGRGGVKQSLYEAGVHFARLWERSGLSSISSPDLAGQGGEGWRGVPDKRLDAIDELNIACPVLGQGVSSRLVDYCALGLTADEIATKHDITARSAPIILENDLQACAKHFRYI